MQFLHNGNCLIINLQQNALKLHEQLSMLQFLWLSAFQMKVKIFFIHYCIYTMNISESRKRSVCRCTCLRCMNPSLFMLYESVIVYVVWISHVYVVRISHVYVVWISHCLRCMNQSCLAVLKCDVLIIM